MTYRPEIDGLRALAVLAVMFFHAGFAFCPGGFTGVDVFFVISGYLITSLILVEMQRGSFSLLAFYKRRARRILPALFLVMLVCIPPAILLMPPDNLENFAQSLVATTAFANNILLWHTSGYFALSNDFKPLMHTWSLGVEEQFYLLYPLLLMAAARGKRMGLALLILSLCAGSLVLAQWLAARDWNAAFFLLPARAWELMVGALLALWLQWRPASAIEPLAVRNAAGTFGLLLILFTASPAYTFDDSVGLDLALTVCGTALVIAYAGVDTFPGKLLASAPLRSAGLLSYSAYLWHQPLFAFARLNSDAPPAAIGVRGIDRGRLCARRRDMAVCGATLPQDNRLATRGTRHAWRCARERDCRFGVARGPPFTLPARRFDAGRGCRHRPAIGL